MLFQIDTAAVLLGNKLRSIDTPDRFVYRCGIAHRSNIRGPFSTWSGIIVGGMPTPASTPAAYTRAPNAPIEKLCFLARHGKLCAFATRNTCSSLGSMSSRSPGNLITLLKLSLTRLGCQNLQADLPRDYLSSREQQALAGVSPRINNSACCSSQWAHDGLVDRTNLADEDP